MLVNPIYLSNKQGVPRIQTSAVTVGTDAVRFTVPSNYLFANTYNGLILLKFSQAMPSSTTTTLPIIVSSTVGGDQAVTTVGGSAWTVANYNTGIYLAYYESNTGTLLLINI